MTKELEEELTKLAFASCKECQEFGYNPTRFKEMLSEHKGRKAITLLIDGRQETSGYTRLYHAGKLELSAEALVLERPRFHVLFTDAQLEKAQKRLESFGYKPVIRQQ